MGKRVAVWVAVLACLFVGYQIMFSGSDKRTRQHVGAGENCVGTLELFNDAFPSEIEQVEKAWGEPIPEDLVRIGGVDWWGWARVCRDGDLWVGEYRDAVHLYQGVFELLTSDGAPLEMELVGTHYMSSFSWPNGFYIYGVQAVEPPVPYFYLRPVDWDLVKRVNG